MPQPNDLSRSFVATDHNSTIIAAVELAGWRGSSKARQGLLMLVESQQEAYLAATDEDELADGRAGRDAIYQRPSLP